MIQLIENFRPTGYPRALGNGNRARTLLPVEHDRVGGRPDVGVLAAYDQRAEVRLPPLFAGIGIVFKSCAVSVSMRAGRCLFTVIPLAQDPPGCALPVPAFR